MRIKLTAQDKGLIVEWIERHYGQEIRHSDHRQSLEDLFETILNNHSGNKALDEALNSGDGVYRP